MPPSAGSAATVSPRSASTAAELPALIDGDAARTDQLVIDAVDPGFLRGDGAFEVIRIYDGVALAMREHLERLSRSAAALSLEYDIATLEDEAAHLCSLLGGLDGYIRIVVTRPGTRILMAEPPIEFPRSMRLLPVAHAVSPLTAGVKSLSYAANCRAHRIADEAGFDDALLIDHRARVLELPFASFAAVFGTTMTVPRRELGVLDSVTRTILSESTRLDVRDFRLAELQSATEACVLGTGMEVCPVTEIADVAAFGGQGPVVKAARAALANSIRRRLDGEARFRGGAA